MMEEFLHMGGYGAFIWPSYGISALFLILLIVFSLRGLRKVEQALEPFEHDRKARRRRPAKEESTPS